MIRALTALLLLFAAACGDRATQAPVAQARPALWTVEGPDGKVAGWLFGTIHALPDGARWETPAVAAAVEKAAVLAVEVRDLDPDRTAAILTRLATDEPRPPLAQRLAAPERRRLLALFARAKVPPDRFDKLETWAAALAVSRLAATTPSANGVDKALLRRFEGRRVAELEGAADQLAIFDRLSERDQRSLLAAVLSEQSNPEADARILAAAWLRGDLVELERITRRGLLGDPALYEALAKRRNTAWVDKLVPMLEKRERPLIAVGAAHMLGPDGLPALIEARGYRVRRVQ